MGLYKKPKRPSIKVFKKPKKIASKTSSREIKLYNRAHRGTNPENIAVFRGYGFPDGLITNVQYCETISLTPSVGTPVPSYGFRLTSLFDPDFTSTGTQPYFFDQLAAVYERYKVLGAKISVTFAYESQTAAGVGPSVVGIQTGEIGAISSNNVNVLRMTSNVSSDVLTTQSDTKTCIATYSPRQSYANTIEDALTAVVTTNPTRNWNAFIFAGPQGTDITKPITAVVTIEYNVLMNQLKPNTGS